MAFDVIKAGDKSFDNPFRTAVIAGGELPKPGWEVVDTFYAYPSGMVHCTTVYVYTLSDHPHHYAFSLDGQELPKTGWMLSFKFDAFNTFMPGTARLSVAKFGRLSAGQKSCWLIIRSIMFLEQFRKGLYITVP